MGRQTHSQGGTGFRMLRAQFCSLVHSKCISKGVQKWTLVGSKVVPPGGSVCGPFISSDVLNQLCRLPCAQNLKLEATLTQTASAKAVQTQPSTPELAQVHVTDPASPHCPPKQRSKFKFLQSGDIFVKQLVAVRRVCVCADAAKNDYLTLRNHCVEGVRGNVPIFEKLWRIRSQANHF